jgi:hypothetical protein
VDAQPATHRTIGCMGKFILGIIVGIVLVIWLVAQCMGVVF